MQQFWQNFFGGFLDCYNFSSATSHLPKEHGILQYWSRVSDYFNVVYEAKCSYERS